ncbi:hypothetical protein L6Q96_05960 [Candidatus Binatia bacterium]|nr:hypothetical protein [Candidatus Binatia bacterium]
MLMRRSGADRLRMGASMFEAAKRLVRASLGNADGRDDSPAMRVQLFLRIYGPDFDAASRARIVECLRGGPTPRKRVTNHM